MVLALFLSWGVNEYITPWANQVSDQLIRQSIRKQPPPKIVDNVFFKEAGNRYLYIEQVNIKSAKYNLLLFEKNDTPFPRIITAKPLNDEKTGFLTTALCTN